MNDLQLEPASLEDQITLLRRMYVLLRGKCYDKRFRMMLTALLSKDSKKYEPKVECMNRLMNIVENSLDRMEADRAFRYLLCFQNMIYALKTNMLIDSKKHWEYLNISFSD